LRPRRRSAKTDEVAYLCGRGIMARMVNIAIVGKLQLLYEKLTGLRSLVNVTSTGLDELTDLRAGL